MLGSAWSGGEYTIVLSARTRLTFPINRQLYSLVMRLLLPLLLLRLMWRSRHHAGYRQNLLHRLGIYGGQDPVSPGNRVWVHAVSVGETVAIAPLLERLLLERPDLSILVTSTTPTGAEQVRRQFGERVDADWVPFDTPGATARFFDHWRPATGVLVETEVWPNLIGQAAKRGIPMVLLNARLSARSARGYARAPELIRQTLQALSGIAAQDRADARRLQAIGANPSRVTVTGNLKFALDTDALRSQNERERARLGDALHNRTVWLAASTHPGEEEMIVRAFTALQSEMPHALLMLAPRHPERVPDLLAGSLLEGYAVALHSDQGPLSPEADILMVDTLGHLGALTGCANLVFVGGSLVAHGGHNPLEAAAWELPVITGPHFFNFSGVYRALLRAGAAQIVEEASLAQTVTALLGPGSDTGNLIAMGQRARAVQSAQGGVLARQWALLQAHLP